MTVLHRKPWSQWTELGRHRERRRVIGELVAGGWSAEEAREIALLSERWADEMDPPPYPGGALPPPDREVA